jgi:hypothetical protein
MLDHLSYSSISLFLSCSEAWRRKYIANEPTCGSPALVFGSAFHGTLEQHIKTDRPLLDAWSEEWQKASTDETRSQIVWNGELPEQHHNEGIRLFSNTDIQTGIEQIRAQYDGGAIERKIELRVPGVPIPIVGYIDITLRGGIPADFKTSAKSWTEDRAKSEMQSLFYLAALNQVGETVPGWTFKHFVFVKTKKPKFQEFEHSHSVAEVFQLFKMIKGVWDAIEAGSFVENTTTWRCGPKYCDFWQNCQGRYAT